MTPKDFYNRYKNLTVSCTAPDGSPVSLGGVAIWRYLINTKLESKTVVNPTTGKESTVKVPAKGSDVYNSGEKIGEVQSAFNDYIQKVKKPGAAIPNGSEVLALSSTLPYGYVLPARVHYGKGTPDDMETVLKAGLLCGKLILWGPPRRDQYVAAVFARDYFGIDCTGFVNAYFSTEGKMNAKEVVSNWWDLNCPNLYHYAKVHGNQILWTPDDVKKNIPGAVIVWMREEGGAARETRTPGHISLVNAVTDGPEGGVTLDCYESNDADPKDDPRNTTRILERVVNDKSGHYWLHNHTEQILVIRPFL